jgi:hypothetical protein
MSILRDRAVASLTRYLNNARQRRSIGGVAAVAFENYIVKNPAVFEAEPLPGMPESQLTQDLRDYLLHAEMETTTAQDTGSAKESK